MTAKRRSRRPGRPRPPPTRGSPYRTPNETILIVCEGAETEPRYFEAWRIAKRFSSLHVEVDRSAGSHPKKVVEQAKELQAIAKKEGDKYDTVWCVFDRDTHEKIHEAFVQALDNKFKIAFSNPSFELWYLLHFEDCGGDITAKKALSKLKLHIRKYSKSRAVYNTLEPRVADAIERAQKLRKQHHITLDECDGESPNPSTWVDVLVARLNKIASVSTSSSRKATSHDSNRAASRAPSR